VNVITRLGKFFDEVFFAPEFQPGEDLRLF
jgi:hypothetical protein